MKAAILISLVLPALISQALAEGPSGIIPRGVSLTAGMTSADILARWGAPRERIELESKRKERWIYAGASLLLWEGKLVGGDRVEAREVKVPEQISMKSDVGVRKHTRKVSDQTVGEILTELKGYGSDSPGSSDSPSTPPGYMSPPNPAMGSIGGQPPGIMNHVP